jgi:hypothetical protein
MDWYDDRDPEEEEEEELDFFKAYAKWEAKQYYPEEEQ